MIPTCNQCETIKQQIKSFNDIGCLTSFFIVGGADYAEPTIKIEKNFKIWKFSDPDLNVIISQLACLYQFLKG